MITFIIIDSKATVNERFIRKRAQTGRTWGYWVLFGINAKCLALHSFDSFGMSHESQQAFVCASCSFAESIITTEL